MNWRRGFFRLWVALSFLWIVFVGAWAYANWPPLKTVYQPASAEEIAACQAKLPPTTSGQGDADRGACLVLSTASETLDYQMIAIYVAAAAGIPILFLFLGTASRWILLGLKP